MASKFPNIFSRFFSSNNFKQSSNILVLNCGSSSIKFQIIDPISKHVALKGIVERLNSNSSRLKSHENGTIQERTFCEGLNQKTALQVISQITNHHQFLGIGHRVVHGGSFFIKSVLVDQHVKKKIGELSDLAPLHNPVNLMGIEYTENIYPDKPQVAVFDTVFYRTLPEKAYRYAVPEKWFTEFKVRKYGFHGISHSYVVSEVARITGKSDLAVVSAHLGNGCSVSASLNGTCLDTSMGFSPLEGLVMGQRSGDIDPTVIAHICKTANCHPDFVFEQLNRESGLFGLTGSADSRDVEESALNENLKAQLAIDIFAYRLAKYISSYLVTLGRLDVLVFTAGIGENSPIKRKKVLDLLAPLGLTCDDSRNASNGKLSGQVISKENASPLVLVIPTNEELVIASETLKEIL